MNRLLVALLAVASACIPLSGLAQDKPAEKKAAAADAKASDKKGAADKKAADTGAKAPDKKGVDKKRKRVGGCG